MAKTKLFDPKPSGLIEHDHNNDGIDRRGFLKCMAWAGTGALCVMQGGVLKSQALASEMGSETRSHKMGELSFVQISDSHMGFNKPANPDVIATLKAAVDKINALPLAKKFSLCRENTTFSTMTEPCSASVTRKTPKDKVGTASTRMESTSSAW